MHSDELGPALKALREGAALTQTELARRLDMTSSAISRAESGASVPPIPTLERWANACGREVKVAFPYARPGVEDPPTHEIAGLLEQLPTQCGESILHLLTLAVRVPAQMAKERDRELDALTDHFAAAFELALATVDTEVYLSRLARLGSQYIGMLQARRFAWADHTDRPRGPRMDGYLLDIAAELAQTLRDAPIDQDPGWTVDTVVEALTDGGELAASLSSDDALAVLRRPPRPRFNLEHPYRFEDVQKLFASADPEAGPHVLWVNEMGNVNLTRMEPAESAREFDSEHLVRFRFPPFPPGNSDIGPTGAGDEANVRRWVDRLVQAWKEGKRGEV